MLADGFIDCSLFAVGAAALILAVRWWRPEVPRRWAIGYALLVFALFAVPLATSAVQVPVDVPYLWRPWRGTLERAAEPANPANPLLADVPLQILPYRTLVRERLLAGEAPLWANELGTGEPLLGNGQSAPFAPLHLMALPIPPLRALTVAAAWQVLVGLLLAHALALALMRPDRVPPPISTAARQLGAAVAAVGFALSAYAVVWLYHPLSMVAMFVPGLVLGIVGLARGTRRAVAGLVGCAVAMAASGHPETLAHAAVVAAGIGLVLLLRGPAVGRWRFTGRAAAAGALALALSAPAVLPVLEALPESQRMSAVQRSEAHGVRPPPASETSFLPLIQPLAFGSPRDGDWNGPRNFNELCSHYAGLLTLALALAGAVVLRGRILAIVAGGGLLLAVAVNVEPVFEAFNAIPGMGAAAHARLRLFWVLAAALAAGLTAAELPTASQGRRRSVALVVLAVAAVAAFHPPLSSQAPLRALWWAVALGGTVVVALAFGLAPAGRLRGGWSAPVLLALVPLAILLDLVLFGARFHPLVGPERQLAPTPSLRWLEEREASSAQPFRVIAEGWGLSPNLAALYGLWDPRGNDPMRPARPEWLLGRRLGGVAWRPGQPILLRGLERARPTLAMLGVRYVMVGRHKRPRPHFRRVFDGPGARLLALDEPLPLFFVAARVRQVDVPSRARHLASTIDDFSRLVVYTDPGSPVTGLQPARPQRGSVWVRSVRANGFELVTRSRDGMLVASSVSDAPGWRLTIDGEPAETVPVDWAFVGFRAPAGVHRVELRYAPAGWRWGLALCGIALAVLAGLAARTALGAAAARRARRLSATAARRPAGSGAP